MAADSRLFESVPTTFLSHPLVCDTSHFHRLHRLVVFLTCLLLCFVCLCARAGVCVCVCVCAACHRHPMR